MLIEIGHVEAIFRYPVKSMGGERLEVAKLGWHGLDGGMDLAVDELRRRGVDGMESRVHLAQVNIGRMKAPLESPTMAGFVARLDEINALADRSPGFVWRLQTPEGNATYLRPYDDDRILFNMSVWETIDLLRDYVYQTPHVELLRQRQEWFAAFGGAYLALWWVPAGHRPSVDEAKKRLAHLAEKGPTPFAFTFREPFPPDKALLQATDWSAFEPCMED
jgi:hypothetical protein